MGHNWTVTPVLPRLQGPFLKGIRFNICISHVAKYVNRKPSASNNLSFLSVGVVGGGSSGLYRT